MGKDNDTIKKEFEVFKKVHGEPSQKLRDYVKKLNQINGLIKKSLKSGAKTVSEISKETNISSQKILWHIMALKKFGKIKEDVQDGDYFKYALTEEK